ncbi:MAG: hypothetical protein MK135_15430, partial [Polyangiaceae bacterium]|nr:hypothetical protein [Polyangiaceae bacterium]
MNDSTHRDPDQPRKTWPCIWPSPFGFAGQDSRAATPTHQISFDELNDPNGHLGAKTHKESPSQDSLKTTRYCCFLPHNLSRHLPERNPGVELTARIEMNEGQEPATLGSSPSSTLEAEQDSSTQAGDNAHAIGSIYRPTTSLDAGKELFYSRKSTSDDIGVSCSRLASVDLPSIPPFHEQYLDRPLQRISPTVKEEYAVKVREHLSHYQILQELGRGAMGKVLRARDQILQREVAIKLILPEVLASDV